MAEQLPVLRAMTPDARTAINRDEVALTRFPFRVGRESRVGVVHGRFTDLDRRLSDESPNNDLYMLDSGRLLHVSRSHLQIDRSQEGGYWLQDRGSACGTVVDGDLVGGHDRGGEHALVNGSQIVVGGPGSPYVFEFLLR